MRITFQYEIDSPKRVELKSRDYLHCESEEDMIRDLIEFGNDLVSWRVSLDEKETEALWQRIREWRGEER